MKGTTLLTSPFLAIFIGFGSLYAVANVDTDDFIEDASELNIAEIESGKLAVEKATYPEVKKFAQNMISEHRENNNELRGIASLKNIELADEATLASKAKTVILKQYGEEAFDGAYANNQVATLKRALELYKNAAKSDDIEVRTFAVAALPKIHKNLSTAESLASEIAKNNRITNQDIDETSNQRNE